MINTKYRTLLFFTSCLISFVNLAYSGFQHLNTLVMNWDENDTKALCFFSPSHVINIQGVNKQIQCLDLSGDNSLSSINLGIELNSTIELYGCSYSVEDDGPTDDLWDKCKRRSWAILEQAKQEKKLKLENDCVFYISGKGDLLMREMGNNLYGYLMLDPMENRFESWNEIFEYVKGNLSNNKMQKVEVND